MCPGHSHHHLQHRDVLLSLALRVLQAPDPARHDPGPAGPHPDVPHGVRLHHPGGGHRETGGGQQVRGWCEVKTDDRRSAGMY